VPPHFDAGITIDKVSKFIGHTSITVTIDRYGHLLPGGEAEAVALLDEHHARRRSITTTPERCALRLAE
jgi:hypothetical protein